MFSAKLGGDDVIPLQYFVLSQLHGSGSLPQLTCENQECGAPVHFYGREAAARTILGVRLPGDASPHFDHFDHTGADCPLNAHNRVRIAGREVCSRIELPPELEMTKSRTIYSLAVMAHMFDQGNMNMAIFNNARRLASAQNFLRLKQEDAWRAPYAIGMATTFENKAGKKLALVRKDFAVLENIDRRASRHQDDMFVVYQESLRVVSGPFELSREATNGYTMKRPFGRQNLAWAKEQYANFESPRLPLAKNIGPMELRYL